ncbi:hypothetical protein CHU98_g11054 [Xylaria longipes]|nr:hypothetical protein CHU98_g11054 [Xylaria longipes]
MSAEEDLIDYSDEELATNDAAPANGKKADAAAAGNSVDKKGSYVGIHSTGFRDFLLKPELLRAIADCGFEHPSEASQVASGGTPAIMVVEENRHRQIVGSLLDCDPDATISLGGCAGWNTRGGLCSNHETHVYTATVFLAFREAISHPRQMTYLLQQTCIPQALLGGDIICQAKSGLGKTAVFVLTTLQQVEPVAGECSVLVMCHTRELAFQIRNEYNRFSKYMPDIKTGVFYGGTPMQKDAEILKNKDTHPHIIVGTPGRLNALIRDKHLRLGSVRIFVLDELTQLDMRRDVQEIFRSTPTQKQVMMFSATLSDEIKPICRKFMQNPTEHYVDEDTKLTLHGLQQYYIKLEEKEKNRKLNELLDDLQFNQVIIFVKSTVRATELDKLLRECNFPSIAVHSGRYKEFKEFNKRICVATDVFGRGIDIERINLAINYDLPADADSYLHRVGRAGRFGTKGLAISFVSSDQDQEVLKSIEKRFEVALPEFPKDGIDASTYMAS